jgi:6-phosphogluconolactonase
MAYHMYVSLQGDDKISRFIMNPQTGALDAHGEVAVPGGPAPMTVDPQRQFLYVGRRGACELSSFGIDPQTGDLTHLGAVSLDSDPCFIATDRSGKFLLSAYYEAATAAVHGIDAKGVVSGPPIEWRHTARGAHCFQTDPSNRFAFVPHIAGRGPNQIWQFRFDAATGRLTPNDPPTLSPEGEVGPRHFCFHPSKDILYFSDEQGSSVSAYTLDPDAGTLTALQRVPTLPDGFTGQNSCAQIQITPSGRFLYAPNRGHNSMACFTVDDATGHLTPVGHASAEAVPRAFAIDPTGNFLYSAGLETGRLAAYRIEADSGRLTPLEVYPVGARPMWVLIVPLTD